MYARMSVCQAFLLVRSRGVVCSVASQLKTWSLTARDLGTNPRYVSSRLCDLCKPAHLSEPHRW